MRETIEFVMFTLFFAGPVVALGVLGYRYGYRQRITPSGIA